MFFKMKAFSLHCKASFTDCNSLCLILILTEVLHYLTFLIVVNEKSRFSHELYYALNSFVLQDSKEVWKYYCCICNSGTFTL